MIKTNDAPLEKYQEISKKTMEIWIKIPILCILKFNYN